MPVLAIDIDTTVLGHGLLAGAVAAVVALTAALVWRNARPGVAGLPIAIAALWTIRHELGPAYAPILIFATAALAFVAGEIGARVEHPLAVYAPVIGGVAFALTPVPAGAAPVLGRIAAAAGAVVLGIALADADNRHAVQGIGVLLLAVTCAAPVFLQQGSAVGPALFGSAIWMVLLLVPKPWVRLGAGGACAAAVAYWWAVLISAGWPQGGDNLVAGAIACGFLLLEPLARATIQHLSGMTNRRRSTRDAVWLVVLTAGAAQCALVAYAAAVTASFDRLDLALLSAVPVLVAGGVVATEIVPSPRRQSRRRTSQ